MLREGLSRTVHNRIVNMARADENRARLGMPKYKYIGYNREMEKEKAKALGQKKKIEEDSQGSHACSCSHDSEYDELDTHTTTEDNTDREVRLFEMMVAGSKDMEKAQTNLIRRKALGFENSVIMDGKYI